MRRSDKEVSDSGMISEVLQRAQVCRIGICDGDTPYVVPMIFGYRDGRVYLHSARDGRKIEAIKRNDRICFEVDVDHALLTADHSCGFDMRYRSIIGFGRACIVEDEVEKRQGLDVIMEHYGEREDHHYREKSFSLALVIRIDLEDMTCRQNGY